MLFQLGLTAEQTHLLLELGHYVLWPVGYTAYRQAKKSVNVKLNSAVASAAASSVSELEKKLQTFIVTQFEEHEKRCDSVILGKVTSIEDRLAENEVKIAALEVELVKIASMLTRSTGKFFTVGK